MEAAPTIHHVGGGIVLAGIGAVVCAHRSGRYAGDTGESRLSPLLCPASACSPVALIIVPLFCPETPQNLSIKKQQQKDWLSSRSNSEQLVSDLNP